MYGFNRAKEFDISPTWTTLNLHGIFIKLPLDRAKPEKKEKRTEINAIKRHVEDRRGYNKSFLLQ